MQELANPSSAEDLRASPIKEKRLGRFSTPDFINQIRARAEDLRASPMKEKRAKRFSPLDLKEQIRTVSAWSAKGSMKRKRQNFFDIVPKNYSGYLPHRSFIARLICSRLALSAAFTFCILIAYKIFLCGSIARAAFLSNFRLCLRSSAQ